MEHNRHTGSLLVTYDPARADVESILEVVCGASGLILDDSRPRVDGGTVLIRSASSVDERVRALTGGRADLRLIVPAVLAGGALVSFLGGGYKVALRWDNLLYWSFAMFRSLHEPPMAPAARSDSRAPP